MLSLTMSIAYPCYGDCNLMWTPGCMDTEIHALFKDLETFEEADAAQLQLSKSEDRQIMANAGALPSEVWG